MKYATIGTVSHGTLRSEDLLDSFADALEDCFTLNLCDLDKEPLERRERLQKLIFDAREMLDVPEDDRGQVWEMSASDIVNELVDALSEFAPPYCYFGTNEGDGSDFGFWPSTDAIDELPKISDPNEVDSMEGEDCVFVNDHGNVTVYSGGRVVLELV